MFVSTDAPCTENKCFAYKSGYCTSLQCSNFGDRKCPFYKTEDQLIKEKKRCEKRLDRIHFYRGDF